MITIKGEIADIIILSFILCKMLITYLKEKYLFFGKLNFAAYDLYIGSFHSVQRIYNKKYQDSILRNMYFLLEFNLKNL